MSQPGAVSSAGHIDGLQFARSGSVREGTLDAGQLPRLAELHFAVRRAGFRLSGAINGNGKPVLNLRATAEGSMPCQRCLGQVDLALSVDAELLLSRSLEEIESADDELDRVLADRAMDVAGLVEDELILELPMVPRHEACGPAAVKVQDAAAGAKPSPFAALAALKRNGKGGTEQ